jgi:hypothetical protein
VKRRPFLAALGAGLAGAYPGRAATGGAATVDAVPTLFHGHPDGLATLVRFTASGVDAPAGRLRVHDLRTGSLAGTAGMIRRGEVLTGELWLPLAQPRRVRSELETPGSRGAIRTIHDLIPTPRWTIYWLTLALPDEVRAAFAAVPDLMRGVEADAMVPAGIRINPWHPLPHGSDHLDLVRLTVPAAAASRATGIPLARLALCEGYRPPHVDRALRGAAVQLVLSRDQVVDPQALDLSVGRTAAAARIEAWLRARAPDATERFPSAVAIGDDLGFAVQVQPRVEEWNAAYAYPRFAVGDGDEVIAGLAATAAEPPAGPTTPVTRARRGTAGPAGDATTPFLPLCRAVSPADPTLAGLARRFAFPVGGLLVFNPSPFGRSDTVDMPDGHRRVVTDVPGLGYAFVPDAPPARVTTEEHRSDASSRDFRFRLEPSAGGIASLVHRPTGAELVAPGRTLNALPDAVLTAVRAETMEGVGARVTARRTTSRGVVTSSITVHDGLPWIEIENRLESGAAGPAREWEFAFAEPADRVVWEVPGGTADAAPPHDGLSPIRWTMLRSGDRAVLLGSEGIAGAAVDGAGRVLVRAPGPCRIRLGYHRGYLLADDPWRFGFGMRPLVGIPTDGSGDRALPTFGRMLDVADPTIAVLAIRPADDGVGLMVFLQDVGGPSRDVVVRPGLLTFDGALLADLAERDVRPAADAPGGGVLVPLESLGYAAVRLVGTGLAS